MTTALTGVEEALDRLAAFSSPSDPVVSLYLNLQSDAHGRREYTDFLDRAFRDQIDTFESGSSARRHLEQDAQRIRTRIESELQTSTRTLAVFCCSGDPALFEAIELDAPIDGHRLYIDRQPHLYPLARLTDQYRRYAALLLDTHSARLFVFAVGAVERKTVVENEKPSRTPGVDVWSEGEYQRNSENLHVKHMKEVADMVERVVREEDIATIVVAADEVALPLFKEAVSSEVQETSSRYGALGCLPQMRMCCGRQLTPSNRLMPSATAISSLGRSTHFVRAGSARLAFRECERRLRLDRSIACWYPRSRQSLQRRKRPEMSARPYRRNSGRSSAKP